MTVLDYYKKHLGSTVENVETLYLSPNLVPDDFPYYAESFNRVVYTDGTVHYFLHPFEFDHTLEPVEMRDEWLKIAKVCEEEEDITEDLEDIL